MGATGRRLSGRRAALVFLAFAFAYFLSALLRAVTATLAPVFSAELGLGAGQLGLLAGTYFFGFAIMQLPLGMALDRIGPKRVLLGLLSLAVVGCIAFALASSLAQLLAARLLIGAGVAACLMAPLTYYRHVLPPDTQLRANAWMLMTGSFGMLASTLPVQWLLPVTGWRGLFGVVAVLLLLAMVTIQLGVSRHQSPAVVAGRSAAQGGYRDVFGHPAFVRMAPMGFFAYGGLIAMQALWIGPWMTRVGGRPAPEAAQALFIVNLSMLVAFLGWGAVMPRISRLGWAGERLIAAAWPASVLCLAAIIWRGPAAGAFDWALWCVLTSVVSLSQPAVAQALPAALAGRALSAFNLTLFAGVFATQWGIGLLIDALERNEVPPVTAYRAAFSCFMLGCAASFLWLVALRRREARLARRSPKR
jgi:MFS family permease